MNLDIVSAAGNLLAVIHDLIVVFVLDGLLRVTVVAVIIIHDDPLTLLHLLFGKVVLVVAVVIVVVVAVATATASGFLTFAVHGVHIY